MTVNKVYCIPVKCMISGDLIVWLVKESGKRTDLNKDLPFVYKSMHAVNGIAITLDGFRFISRECDHTSV